MLGPMSEAELRQAIELPAQAAGVRFAPGMVERLIGDAVGRPNGTDGGRSGCGPTFRPAAAARVRP